MGSQGCGSHSNGATRTQIQNQDPKSNPLNRQGSLYSLTLDEVQTQLGDLGKPLNSMNLDELLKTVWSVESNNNQAVGGLDYELASQPESGSSLNRQSSLTMSRDLSKKTVDEVWQDIQQGQKRSGLDRKATLGEITLEDFLVKAGVVAESSPSKKSTGPVQTQWMNYQTPVFMPGHHPVQPPIPIGNPIMDDCAYTETQMTMSSSPLMGTLSDTQTPGRKRFAPGDIVEKSVERRQKRMIKNRESAARSRARKQAYTHELENKVSRLEEENERLKRRQEFEKELPSIPPPEPKYQLRRTSSAPI
ncbi:hypothetical protein RD792_008243 [Penstemon davidsonii]|uniref:BZIP domain-containing protein n=1 Tax=Penstemon davidsonii TaxID=160366 RepID=A0ABR0D8Q2_9LAMI|nr:hypothetical protein RD792_008243 [Penstemon davidsonii]